MRRGDLLDLVAELGQQGRGSLDGRDGLAIGVRVDGGRGGVADPEPARALLDLLRERDGVPRALVARPRVGADDRVQQRRRVAHGAGHHALGDHPEHHLAGLRTVRPQPPAGLQPHEAVAGRGDADRAAAVVGAGSGYDARRDRRAGAAGRAARGVVGVPGVAGRTPQCRLGDALGAELRGVGLAEDDEAGVEEALRDQCVPVGDVVGQGTAAVRGREAGVLLAQVLDQEGHAGEGTLQVGVGGTGVGDVGQRCHDGVQRRVHLVQPPAGQGEQLGCRDLLVRHQVGQGGRVTGEVLVEVHPGSVARHQGDLPELVVRTVDVPLPSVRGSARTSGRPGGSGDR